MPKIKFVQKKYPSDDISMAIESSNIRFDSIDGLRGIVCLGVVVLHCYTLAGGYPVPLHLNYLIEYGYVGVDVFFTLSGFCLAYPIFKKGIDNFSWKQYIWNRARRILPPYWVVLVISLILSQVAIRYNLQSLRPDAVLTWKPSLYDIVKNFSLFQSNDYIISSWTLPIEWRWYLILPLFVFLSKLSIYVPILLSIVVSVIASHFLENPSVNPRLVTTISTLPIYLPTFLIGIWIAYISQNKKLSILEQFFQKYSLWLLIFSIVLALLENPKWNLASSRVIAWTPVCFFLVMSALYNRRFKSVLEWRPLVEVGIFSCSLYLTHEILIKFLYLMSSQLRIPESLQWIFHLFLTFPLALLVGYLFFVSVEYPLLKLARKIKIPA
jgi:exopolysaccharide production protein ExoZ